jgi:succinoglycan biosynthesis transport protein ExoP
MDTIMPGRPVAPTPVRPQRRGRVFAVVFAVALVAALVFTFARPAIYRSAATLLVEAPEAPTRPLTNLVADPVEAAGAALALLAPSSSPVQLLATERQRLLSPTLLSALAAEFTDELAQVGDAGPLAALQAMAQVDYDPATNLLDVALEGPTPALQQRLLERWLALYETSRVADTTASRGSDDEARRTQLAALEEKIAAQRARIDDFRQAHGIVSDAREDNRAAAKLKGLNEAINAAEDEEMRATARLAALERALAAGEPVTQGQDRAAIDRLEERVAALRDQVRAQGDQYTEKYAAIAPEITAARKDLAQAEADLEAMRLRATDEVIGGARTALASARDTKAGLVAQQAALRRELAAFNTRFDELRALRDELAGLEAQAAPLRERLVRAEVAAGDLAPRVSVLAPAATPARPLRPDYLRDAGLGVAAAFVLAWLATLFHEFLTRTPAGVAAPEPTPTIYSMNTQLFPPPGVAALPPGAVAALPGQPLPGLPAPPTLPPRELAPAEAAALLAAGDRTARLAVALGLLGVGAAELVALRVADLGDGQLDVGRPPRALAVPESLRVLIGGCVDGREPDAPLLTGADGAALTEADLAGMLTWVAHDAGLSQPAELGFETLRHTYFAWLVRQGLRLGELPRVGGALPPQLLASYAAFAPPGAGRSLEEVAQVYPALSAPG